MKILFKRWLSLKEPIKAFNPQLKSPVFLRPATTDPVVYSEIFVQRIYDVSLPATARFIIDAGANIGLSSVFFSNRYPEATVVAIEPSNDNMALLRKNAASYPNVHPHLAGLWPYSGPLRITNAGAEEWAIKVEACSQQESDLTGITIPDILEEYQVKQIDLLKIDIEGAEWPLFFDTPPTWLGSVNLLIIELHRRENGGSFDIMVKLMENHHLKLFNTSDDVYIFNRGLN